ncbi:MAG: hypothetical protein ACO3B7_05145 [Candidatus Limnocylindrus sp.]
MTTTTQQVPATVQRILDAGTIAYVPGGFKKFEDRRTYFGDCFTLPVIEFRRDVLVRHKERGNWVDKVNAIIVDVTENASGNWLAKHRCRAVVTVGGFGEAPRKTGEYCVPVRDLALHWVDGDRFETVKAAVRQQDDEQAELSKKRIQRDDAILQRFAKELGVTPVDHGYGGRLYYSGLSTDHGTGDNITVSFGAFKTLCERLGIDLENLEN